jgi:two-component system LytT family response regulator
MTLRALIVDDEPLARESLRLLLSAHGDVEIAGEAADGRAAVAAIRRRQPDLLFLDVQMPGMSGFDVLRKLGAVESMAVIFVTAYDRYAIQAFETRALDYLLKPYTDDRFEQVLARAKQHVNDRTLTTLGARVLDLVGLAVGRDFSPGFDRGFDPGFTPDVTRDTLLIKDGKRTVVLPVATIDWIEATDYYARVHTAGKSYLMRESLTSLAATLSPGIFVRVHRSAIVNIGQVAEVESVASGDAVAVLISGERVKVSRTFRSSLIARVSLHRPSPR